MRFDFDLVIDRSLNHSFKWNRYQGQDVIPSWVADADFRCAPAINQAMAAMAEHGIYGYIKPEEYAEGRQAIVDWLEFRHGFAVDPDWIVWMPGVVPAFNTACKAYTQPGQSLLIQSPNYPPILSAHKNHALRSKAVAVKPTEQGWELDLAEIEAQAASADCQMMILCNPMNPCGAVIGEQQLQALAAICQRHQLVLCSDEIHCDLILDPSQKHIPAYSIDVLRDHSITLMSAAKTFNIAGLGVSFGIIPSAKLRRQYLQAANGIAPWANNAGLLATTAALRDSREWYADMIQYLRGNRDYLCAEINKITGLSVQAPQATFLAWVDASGLGVDNVQAWFEARGVGPSPGRDFGDSNYARINYACARSVLEDIVQRLR